MEKSRLDLENEKILLRKPEPEDIDFLSSLENNQQYWWVSDTRTPFSRWQIKQHIENSVYDIFTNKELRLIITNKEDNSKIGVVDLFDYDPMHDRVGIGIIIMPEFQNQKFAEQTLSIITDYCFNVLNINQIWCNIDAENIVSIKLFEKAKFVKCGVLKQWKKLGKLYCDVFVYQFIRT